jgi:predicted transcriptional regulator of viral defense system
VCPGDTESPRYGGAGLALLRQLADEGRQTFTFAQARALAGKLGVADSYLPVLLHRLEQSRLLQRLKHGTYALAAGPHGASEVHPFAVGMALIDPSAISGWSALNHHGLTEQIPRLVSLTTPKRVVTPAMRGAAAADAKAPASVWNVAGQQFEIVNVIPSLFFGVEEVWFGDSKVRIFDKERALLDCFALPRRFGGVAEGLGMVEDHLRELNLERLVAHAVRYGKAAVAKRVGFALELAGAPPAWVEPLRSLPMTGFRPLDPTRPTKGPRNRGWGLVENLGPTGSLP